MGESRGCGQAEGNTFFLGVCVSRGTQGLMRTLSSVLRAAHALFTAMHVMLILGPSGEPCFHL